MRTAEIKRATNETDITLWLDLDGTGKANIKTGIGFFDHMLTAFAVHSGFDIELTARGDLDVDCHHTVEDVAIVLGMALAQTVKRDEISRYGSFAIPMDEALAECSLDFSGRPFLVFNAQFSNRLIGGYETAMTEHFFLALANNSGLTLHINVPYGRDDHHKTEAIFKAVAHSISIAVKPNTAGKVLSSKGSL